MSERPFMQLYVSDFVGDTLMLSAAEIGAYALLLMAAWGAEGYRLPADARALAEVAHMSPGEWAAAWPALSRYFDISDSMIRPRAFDEWRRARNRIYGRTPLSLALRLQVLERDGPICHYCGKTDGPFHVDHVLAVARGGTDALENLVVACKRCNLSKGAKLAEEWRP